MIYKRFTEKSAEEWRQIYKALQLLEFLIKNGSERVIDDARSHLTLLKMLRQFHFIDANGKDQGLNVRNRAKELADLLSDVDRIRAERKKSKTTRNKYTGVEGGAGLGGSGFSSGGGSRYGGFGSETGGAGSSAEYGGYNGGVYGDGGGFGGQSNDFQDGGHSSGGGGGSSRRDKFQEYDEYDEGAVSNTGRRQADAPSSARRKPAERPAVKKAEPPKKKEPEVDLFSFDDPIPTSQPAVALASHAAVDEDDFDDFQSATPAQPVVQPSQPAFFAAPPPSNTTQFAAPQPVSAPQQANLSSLVGFNSISPAPSNTTTPLPNYSAFSSPPQTTANYSNPASSLSSPPIQPNNRPAPTSYQSTQPNYFTSVKAPTQQPANNSNSGSSQVKSTNAKPASSGGDAFGSLWSTASAGVKKTSTPGAGPALGQLAKEKASAGIWGAPAQSNQNAYGQPQQQKPSQQQQSSGNGLDDLLG